jgi:hypothetical protein
MQARILTERVTKCDWSPDHFTTRISTLVLLTAICRVSKSYNSAYTAFGLRVYPAPVELLAVWYTFHSHWSYKLRLKTSNVQRHVSRTVELQKFQHHVCRSKIQQFQHRLSRAVEIQQLHKISRVLFRGCNVNSLISVKSVKLRLSSSAYIKVITASATTGKCSTHGSDVQYRSIYIYIFIYLFIYLFTSRHNSNSQ